MVVREPEGSPETERLRRLEVLDELVTALAGVLSLKEAFDRVSQIAQKVLTHDALVVVIPTGESDRGRVYALRGFEGIRQDLFTRLRVSAYEAQPWDYRIIDDLTSNPDWADSMSVRAGLKSALSVPIRRDGHLTAMVTFVARELNHFTADDVVVARRIADHIALSLSHERLAEERERRARLEARATNLEVLDGLLGALTGVLTLREAFEPVSQIAHKVLPHDAMAVLIPTGEGDRAQVYAIRGFGEQPQVLESRVRGDDLLTEPWDHRIIADLTADPLYADTLSVKAGLKSGLLLPIRLDGRLHAIVSFVARETNHFTNDDVLVARRIVDHMALALSHEKLAAEQRRNEEMRSRAASMAWLEEVISAVTGSGQLPEVWERISAVAQRVLPHDALMLAAALPERGKVRVYASWAPSRPPMADIVSVPPAMLNNPNWEYDLVEDLQAQEDQQHLEATKLGYRAALRVPLRLDGEFIAALAFLSLTPAAFTEADVGPARRIGDRLVGSFARERRLALRRQADEASERASRLEARVRELTDELDARTGYRRVVGESPSLRRVLVQATQVAVTDTTVLLLGESGTGKEVAARFIHRASTRKNGPFVALNCAALPEQLLEAELFGYERGAFTGAVSSKPGQLEQASGGTLFLDEVGEMSLPAQAKFLRVLQEREFQRLGGTRVLKTDARIIAATNRDLRQAIQQGQFREDLFYRLNVFAIELPPLRERREDVLALSEAFLKELGTTLGRPPAGISRNARERLTAYHWPGNVRELRNILERAAILCEGGLITEEHLALAPVPAAASPPAPSRAAGPVAVAEGAAAGGIASMEKTMIEQALRDAKFNKSKAAKQLGLTRTQLYVRLRRYGLE